MPRSHSALDRLIWGWSLFVLASAIWRAVSGDSYWIRHIVRDAVLAGVVVGVGWCVVALWRKGKG